MSWRLVILYHTSQPHSGSHVLVILVHNFSGFKFGIITHSTKVAFNSKRSWCFHKDFFQVEFALSSSSYSSSFAAPFPDFIYFGSVLTPLSYPSISPIQYLLLSTSLFFQVFLKLIIVICNTNPYLFIDPLKFEIIKWQNGTLFSISNLSWRGVSGQLEGAQTSRARRNVHFKSSGKTLNFSIHRKVCARRKTLRISSSLWFYDIFHTG